MKIPLYQHRILGISPMQLAHGFKTGRIQRCKKCGEIQFFERKTFNRWNDVCVNCSKTQKPKQKRPKSLSVGDYFHRGERPEFYNDGCRQIKRHRKMD